MNRTLPSIILLLLALGVSPANAEPLPKSIASSACKTPPTIDGTIGNDEWRDAKAIDFQLEMVGVNPPSKGKRACSIRIMNSANALYLAFRVPDTTLNATLNPLDFDLAMLAFCKGKELQTGDDRKVIAPGLYADKHFVAPNKDGDDKQKDGRGAVVHEKGVYSYEWAIPLDSGDSQDLQTNAGESIRFNLAIFDGFRAELKDTQVGGAYGAEVNNASAWGTIELAAKVEKDDGSAFRGPAWVESLIKGFKTLPANRLRFAESSLIPGVPSAIAKALVSFNYRDPTGEAKEGKAAIYFPATLRDDPKAKLPLFFAAGYEINDDMAAAQVRRGFAVVTPRLLDSNPLIRTSSPDIALMHIARALPFVDDAKVMIGGGSAGGYMTLMLAAETFPLAGAMPDVPPVNWGYNAAYFFKQKDLIAPAKGAAASKVPVLFGVGTMLAPATKVYGEDYGDKTWFAHSPVAHVPTITCPVQIWWTTADVLVPIDQVGKKWVKPMDASTFPAGFTMDPEKLLTTKEGRARFIDALDENSYEVFELSVPKGTAKLGQPGKAHVGELPVSNKQWSLAIVDEGPPEPNVGHAKYAANWSRDKFVEKAKKDQIAASQLTPTKLARLMDRYAGKEWLPSPLKHLDEPESEKADVLRGLRTYVAAGPENAKTFAELYAKLPVERRVLDEKEIKALSER